MTRKRIRHAILTRESARRACLRKRKGGLFKKTHELCVLCDVEAAAVVYSPGEAEPQVWPSMDEAVRLMKKYIEIPLPERSKKMTTQETYLKERLDKETDKTDRVRSKNDEMEAKMIMNQMMQSGSMTLDQIDPKFLGVLSKLTTKLTKLFMGENEEDDPPQPAAAADHDDDDEEDEDVLLELTEEGETQDQGGDGGADVGIDDEEFLRDLEDDSWFLDAVAHIQAMAAHEAGAGGTHEVGPSGTHCEAGPSGTKDIGQPPPDAGDPSSSSSGTSIQLPSSPWPDLFSP